MQVIKWILPVLFLLLCCAQRCDARTLTANDWLYVPVLYATDRPLDDSTDHLTYSNEQMPDLGNTDSDRSLNYGIKTIKVHLPIGCSLTESEAAALGCIVWSPNDAIPGAKLLKNMTSHREQFLADALEIQKNAPEHRVLLFVHGCCTPHDAAMEKAALATVWYRCPVIMYDWDSPMWNYSNIWSAADYHRNEDHCAAAEKRFVDLVDDLEAKLDVTKVGALAHSMGNRLLDAYIVQRHAKNSKDPTRHAQLMLLEFANADLSTIRASGNLGIYAESAVKCRIYVDNEDPALEASRKIHSGNRVGAPHAQLDLLTSKETLAPDVVDHGSISGKTHDLPFWLCSDLSNFGSISPNRRCALKSVKLHLYEVKSTAGTTK